ncbi:hypothetical protein [Gulosibacter sp. 10]|uniref:hypothetical protein n=1 Tax=Gulosibacter sp. 10 TaxID=1255570 RepID=UPI00097F47B2|nr:hypothetical protein [Gulosibacter sp. 10]SJM61363.1 hypothetical protein FM112_07820 [Gulosibacter sp. 10]
MAYEPQTWADGEDGGTPITADRLNHIEQGIAEVTWGTLPGKPEEFPPAGHKHPAADITSGTFAVARIPDLAIAKITGLEARLAAIEARLPEA